MPSPVCFVCSDKERRKEVDALLRDGGESFESIATIVGTSRWAIARHKRKHFDPKEIASQERHGTRLENLYAKCERLLARAEKKGDMNASIELSRQLGRLHKLIESQQANIPKESCNSPWSNSLARALGYTPRGLTRELVRDMKMWMKREADAPVALQACAAFFVAACADEQDRPDLAEGVKPVIERFLLEIAPHLQGVIDEVVQKQESDYSAVDLFGPET